MHINCNVANGDAVTVHLSCDSSRLDRVGISKHKLGSIELHESIGEKLDSIKGGSNGGTHTDGLSEQGGKRDMVTTNNWHANLLSCAPM